MLVINAGRVPARIRHHVIHYIHVLEAVGILYPLVFELDRTVLVGVPREARVVETVLHGECSRNACDHSVLVHMVVDQVRIGPLTRWHCVDGLSRERALVLKLLAEAARRNGGGDLLREEHWP